MGELLDSPQWHASPQDQCSAKSKETPFLEAYSQNFVCTVSKTLKLAFWLVTYNNPCNKIIVHPILFVLPLTFGLVLGRDSGYSEYLVEGGLGCCLLNIVYNFCIGMTRALVSILQKSGFAVSYQKKIAPLKLACINIVYSRKQSLMSISRMKTFHCSTLLYLSRDNKASHQTYV